MMVIKGLNGPCPLSPEKALQLRFGVCMCIDKALKYEIIIWASNKKDSYFPIYCLFNWDPYNGLL